MIGPSSSKVPNARIQLCMVRAASLMVGKWDAPELETVQLAGLTSPALLATHCPRVPLPADEEVHRCSDSLRY
jgi:hypothetical protein